MAKQKITDAIQKKFDKPQFQPGAAVFFSWLGQKQCGYVTKFKKVGWGVQYMVQAVDKKNYPCGMEIQNEKTPYCVGYIFYETTKSIGHEELERRIQTERNAPKSRPIKTVSIDAGGTKPKVSIDSGESRSDIASIVKQDAPTRSKRPSTKVDTKSSATRNIGSDTKTRGSSKKSKLEQAFEKQKSFLDFTKPLQKD
jgi:hypothetical protein